MRPILRDHVQPVAAAWDAAVDADSSAGWRELAAAGAELAAFAGRVVEVAEARAAACRTVEQDVADLMLALDALWESPDPVAEPADLDELVAALDAADAAEARPAETLAPMAPERGGLLVLTHDAALDDVHELPDVRVHLARIA